MVTEVLDEPRAEEVRKARQIGRKGNSRYIWTPCINCGKYRWVQYRHWGAVSKWCPECSHKLQNKNRGGYSRLNQKSELIYGSGCKHHGTEHGKPLLETGCFDCPYSDCIWDSRKGRKIVDQADFLDFVGSKR